MIYCPLMSHNYKEDFHGRECKKEYCGLWSAKHSQCSVVAMAEKDIVFPSVINVEKRERISY